MAASALPKAKIDGWIRKLEGDRLEVFLKVERFEGIQDRKIRASGPTGEMYELVDWFEEKTGLTVNVPDRVRTGPRPIDGQMQLTMGTLPPGRAPGEAAGEAAGAE